PAFFADLRDPRMKSAIALVHQRFSTNTFPSWDRAHPYRYIAHNGEINTLRGNENWMRAREPLFVSETFGDDVERIRPVVDEDSSDSGKFDNALELLVHTGRSLPHAVMMMIPEAWQKHESMSASKREFYEYHSCLMEPWDGPASIAFSDGTVVGAILDRNGLRPSRYVVTRDGLVVMASEVGVLDIPPSEIVQKNRLQPGRMFLVDLSQGRIVDDEEIKEGMAARRPYGEWLRDNLVRLGDLPAAGAAAPAAHSPDDLRRLQLAFGYTLEDLRFLMGPMAVEGQEAIGSMGTDTPLAVLSDKPQLLFNYFKQLFAQVTNPPIDPIREELVMSLRATVGAERNLFEETPLHCRQLSLETPILRDEELAAIRANGREGLRAETVSTLWEPTGGVDALERALDALCREASAAVARGASIVVLSDRGVDARRAAIPSLLAVAAVHHHLIREGSRKRCGLVLESAEPREVHHFSLLVGYGAGAINPYLAFETLGQQIRDGVVKGIDEKEAVDHFVKAVDKGLLKVMSKMGISTLQSYRGAQIFEAIGLSSALVERYFTWTASRIEGIGLDEVAAETALRHRDAFEVAPERDDELQVGGQYQYRRRGEYHMYNPETIAHLQHAVRKGDYGLFKKYTELQNAYDRHLCTLRGLLRFRKGTPIPIEEVEPASEIVKRFKTGAMSLGSISREAHENLAIAMNRLGGRSNTGEGGEDPARYSTHRNSAIKQVASGRFGVTPAYLASAHEIEIKMAQGAKPGEGGQLPGHKVTPLIARLRHSVPGVPLISPPPHHDIYSIEDLAQLVYNLRQTNPRARISVKCPAVTDIGTIAVGIAK
ncbi:MAG: glutamate synthase central domain-containing protein, partial [Alphaproteobacteria bacterium]